MSNPGTISKVDPEATKESTKDTDDVAHEVPVTTRAFCVNRWTICFCGVLSLLLLLIVIAIGLFLSSQDEDPKPTESTPTSLNFSLAQSASATKLASPQATASKHSLDPPELSSSCGATPISLDGATHSGDLMNASESSVYLTYTSACCSTQTYVSGTGTWYTFTGNGLDVTMEFDGPAIVTPLVLTGTCTGGSDPFLSPNDSTTANAGVFGESPQLKFATNVGVQYWLFIYTEEYGASWGGPPLDFSMPYKLKMTTQAYCEGAVALLGASVTVSNLLHLGEVATGLPACGDATAPVGQGLWYSITGDDKSYRLSTERRPTLDTQISVYQGSSCDELECVTGNDNALFAYDGHSVVHFPAFKGLEYHILVHGGDADDIGFFDLAVDAYALNDVRAGAVAVDLPVRGGQITVSGSTADASVDEYGLNFCIQETMYPAVWYEFQGGGQNVDVAVPADSTETCLDILKDDGVLGCVFSSYYECVQNRSFIAQAGVTYFVLVSGPSVTFDMTITASAQPTSVGATVAKCPSSSSSGMGGAGGQAKDCSNGARTRKRKLKGSKR